MPSPTCHLSLCFVPLDPSGSKFFGFSEYLAALALMILVWTTADVRSRFRLATAPVPLHRLSFGTIAFVGIATLLTDLWREEGWLVPAGPLLTPGIWQALLGAIFLINFLSWGWFAYVRPPKFCRHNAKQFGAFLFSKIEEGNGSNLTILAQELRRSAPSLVAAASSLQPRGIAASDEVQAKIPIYREIAHEIFLLIADPRFCRAMVSSSPATIYHFFYEIRKQRRFNLPVYQFGRNIVQAAIEDKNSFLYHEGNGYYTGLLGYINNVSQAVFGSYALAEASRSLLDPEYAKFGDWSADQWRAYNRAVLITLTDYVEAGFWNHSVVLYQAFHKIGNASNDVYKLDGTDGSGWEEDCAQRLRAGVDFCKKVTQILDDKGVPDYLHLRIRKDSPTYFRSVYDWLTDLMFDCIKNASKIKRPQDLCWAIQHNTVWSEFFDLLGQDTNVRRVILFKLRRRIYDEIKNAERYPNYVNVPILFYCLNVMGLAPPIREYGRNWWPLHKALLAWTVRHFAVIAKESPHVVAHSLPDGISYDKESNRLVKTNQVNAFRVEPSHIYLELQAPFNRSE